MDTRRGRSVNAVQIDQRQGGCWTGYSTSGPPAVDRITASKALRAFVRACARARSDHTAAERSAGNLPERPTPAQRGLLTSDASGVTDGNDNTDNPASSVAPQGGGWRAGAL